MSRITQEIAKDVSNKMVSKMTREIKVVEQSIQDILHKYVKTTIPQEVVDFYEKFPLYVKSTTHIQLSGNGFDFSTIQIELPIPRTDNSSIQFQPTAAQATTLQQLINRKNQQVKLKDELKQEVFQTLLNLKTFKRVEVEFKEAFKYLPTSQTNALTIPIASLREKLQSIS